MIQSSHERNLIRRTIIEYILTSSYRQVNGITLELYQEIAEFIISNLYSQEV